MAVSTAEAPEEKTDTDVGEKESVRNNFPAEQKYNFSRRTASLRLENDAKPALNHHKLPIHLSYPRLSSLYSCDTNICCSNHRKNETCDSHKIAVDNDLTSDTPSSNNLLLVTGNELNENVTRYENGENEDTKSDVILFMDNSVEDNDVVSGENKVHTNCDGPLLHDSSTSLDKISFEEYKDDQDFGEKCKKYSASSHKVKFADMAVFDGEGEIHLSPLQTKQNETKNSPFNSYLQYSDRNTICPSILSVNEDEMYFSPPNTSELKHCTCSNSPTHKNEVDNVNMNNNNGGITGVQCKKCNISNSRERTMSDCSYFSNASSVSLASKLTTGTDSSETSSSSSSSSSSSTASFSTVAPDGGWGWVIVFAAFLVNMIADGVTFSVGVMFVDFQKEFGHSKSRTAIVIGLFHAIPMLSGPIASALTDRYGCRKVTIAGSLIATLGFLLSSLANSLEVLYLTFGVIAGFGLSLCYVAAVVIVAYYFERRRSFATGISVCGSGVGTFVFAPLTRILIEEYGWRGACVILAGCFLNMCVCGALFRDLEWTVRKRKRKKLKHKLSVTKSISPIPDHSKISNQNQKRASIGSSITHSFRRLSTPNPKMPDLEELKLQILEGGDLSRLYSEEDMTDSGYLTSSLCHLPTWISNAKEAEGSSSIPEEFITVLSRNEKACDIIKNKYPDSLIAVSLKDNTAKYRENNADTTINEKPISVKKQTIFKLPRTEQNGNIDVKKIDTNNSLNTKMTESIETLNGCKLLNEEKPRIGTPNLVRKVSGYFKKCQKIDDRKDQELTPNPKSILKKEKHMSYEHEDDDVFSNKIQRDNLENSHMRGRVTRAYSCRRSSGTDALIRQKNLTQQRSMYLHRLRLRRQSLTYRGAMLNIPRYRLRSSNSCPDIFRNSMTTIAAEELAFGEQSMTNPMYWMHRVYDEHFRYCCALPGCTFERDEGCRGVLSNWKKIINISFGIFLLSNFILYAWYDVMYVYLLDYAEKELSFSSTDSTFLLSVIGIINTVGEVLIGWIGDQKWANLNALYAACMLACGIATACVPFLSMYKALATVAGIFGFAISANYSLTSPILVNMVSIDEFSSAYGLLLLVQGVSNLVGPPFAGYLYDISHIWHYTFGLGGLFIAISGILVVILPLTKGIKSLLTRPESIKDQKKLQDGNQLEQHPFITERKNDEYELEDKYIQGNGIQVNNINQYPVDTHVIFEGPINGSNENMFSSKSFNESNIKNNFEQSTPTSV